MSPGGASVPQVVINSLEWQKLWMASTLCHSTSLQDKYPEEYFEKMLKQRNNGFPSNLPPCHHHHPPLHCRQKLTCPTPWWWRVCERWLLRFDPVERPQALLAPPDGHDVIQFEKDGPLNDKSDGDTFIIRLSLFTPSDHESAHPRLPNHHLFALRVQRRCRFVKKKDWGVSDLQKLSPGWYEPCGGGENANQKFPLFSPWLLQSQLSVFVLLKAGSLFLPPGIILLIIQLETSSPMIINIVLTLASYFGRKILTTLWKPATTMCIEVVMIITAIKLNHCDYIGFISSRQRGDKIVNVGRLRSRDHLLHLHISLVVAVPGKECDVSWNKSGRHDFTPTQTPSKCWETIVKLFSTIDGSYY